jgi:hypothetical protein
MVGTAIYGDAWIDQLTYRERWLLDRYINKPSGRLLVEKSAFYRLDGLRNTVTYEPPPALRSEIDQAKDRYEWQLSQRTRVFDWFVQHGMDVRFRREKGSLIIPPRSIEKLRFERAFDADFASEPSKPTGRSLNEPDQVRTYQTGMAGRPTSWHLIERECRRRYEAGERHAGKSGESPTGWADSLIPWLADTHPEATPLTQKAATNKLSPLLRELQAGFGAPNHRPK